MEVTWAVLLHLLLPLLKEPLLFLLTGKTRMYVYVYMCIYVFLIGTIPTIMTIIMMIITIVTFLFLLFLIITTTIDYYSYYYDDSCYSW